MVKRREMAVQGLACGRIQGVYRTVALGRLETSLISAANFNGGLGLNRTDFVIDDHAVV